MPPQHPQHKKHQVPQRLLKGMMVSSSWFRARFISLAWLEDPTTWHLVKKITQLSYTGDKYWQMIFNVCIKIYFCEKQILTDTKISQDIYFYDWTINCRLSGFRSFSQVASRFSCCSCTHGLHKYQLQYKMFCFPFLATNRCWNHKNGKNDPFLVSAQYYKDLLLAHTQHNNLRHIISFPRCSILRKIMAYLPPSSSLQLLAIGDAAVVTGTL